VYRRFLLLLAIAFAIGIGVLLYRGPGQPIVRGHVGDVAAAMAVYAVIGLAAARFRPTRIAIRAGLAFAIAALVEIGQSLWTEHSTAGHLVFGNTFDPWDLLAYAIGAVLAALYDHRAAGT
jgi:hypothetical protein